VDAVDGEKGNKAFAKSLDADYPILSDPTKETAKAYGVLSERGFANRWTFYIGKDGKILFIDDKVNAKAHGADVAAKLKELGVVEKK
jgi:peroxiredoxin Q/BCP